MAVPTPGLLSGFLWQGLGRSWDLSQGQEKDLEAPFMKPAQKRGGIPRWGLSPTQAPLWGTMAGGGVEKQQNQLSNDALELPLRLEAEWTFLYPPNHPRIVGRTIRITCLEFWKSQRHIYSSVLRQMWKRK